MSEQEEAMRKFAQEKLRISVVEKPEIWLPGPNVRMSDTATALFKAIEAKGGMFYRGEKIVTLEEPDGGSLPVLAVVNAAQARTLFEEYATFKGTRKNAVVTLPMSKDIAEGMLQSSIAKKGLPNVTGLINTPLPILYEGAMHVLEPGYDVKTGLFVTGASIVEPKTIEEAVQCIETSLADFEFQSDGDISRAIAAILTPALKFGGFLKGTIPVEIIEADESQSGKGYLTLRRAAIYGEHPTTISQQKGGVGSADEKFASALVKGRPFILFDNWRGRFDSMFLESFLTAQGSFSVRIPHAGEGYVDPSRFCLTITSNGIDTTEDLANRASFVRLRKNATQPVLEIEGKRMLETIRDAQPYFLGAVTKIIRHWFELGMPRTQEKRHSFTPWAQSLDWIVQNIFGSAPLLEGMADAQSRIQSPNLSFLRLIAIQVEKQGKLGNPLTAREMAEICDQSNIEIPGLNPNQAHNEKVPMQRIGSLLKPVFGDKNEITFERFSVRRTEIPTKTEAGNASMLKYYEFQIVSKNPAHKDDAPTMVMLPDESLVLDQSV